MRFGLALALWIALVPGGLRAALPPDLEARARAIAEEERARAGTPAMSVAVFAADGEVVSFALGRADVEADVAATPETLFPAASVTKLLTAALVLRAVERGALSLDTPVNEALPAERQVRDAEGAPAPVTLRMLLSHSSGLPVSWAGIQRDPDEPPLDFGELLAHGLRTVRAPGDKLIYANGGFTLAGWLAARADGVPFDALAERALFAPLGMTHSTLAPPRDAGPRLAAAYGSGGPFGGRDRVPHQTVSGTAPAGALITTAPDLARFGMAMLRGGELEGARVLTPASVAEMMRMQARAHPRLPEGFGLGFGVREVPGRKLVWWDGGLAGAASRLALLPEHGVGVAILSNLADNAPVSVAARRILDALVPPPAREPAVPTAAELEALAGTYRLRDVVDPSEGYLQWFADLRLTPAEGAILLATPLSREPARLVPAGDGLYVVEGSILDGSFALVTPERAQIGFVVAERISVWRSGRALIVYVGIAALALLAALLWLTLLWRRRRRARSLATT
jgi:CubicO group peptidase (beta-lactamase class C family)